MTDGSGGFDQSGHKVRMEWGPHGLRRLAPVCDVVIVIDVLSFTTAVEILTSRGATVHPYRWHDGSEAEHAKSLGAYLAARTTSLTDDEGARIYSLSPETLLDFPAGQSIVLPSPNGSALAQAATEAGASHVIAGCLRNATAVGRAATDLAGSEGSIGVIPAGERWHGATGPMRVAWEDLMGAGAIIDAMGPMQRSPEAQSAAGAFVDARDDLVRLLLDCNSGREHVERGTTANVAIAGDVDISNTVPILVDDAFVPYQPAEGLQ